MPALDFSAALGRLLTSHRLREAFDQDRVAVLDALCVAPESRPALAALDRAGLEAQAQSLLSKRMAEARKLLPQTFARLGSDAKSSFMAHAESDWPSGHFRHVLDAAEYALFLHKRGDRRLTRAEYNRVRFAVSRSRLRVRWASDAWIDGRSRWALQVLYRGRAHSPRQLMLYWATPRSERDTQPTQGHCADTLSASKL